MLRSKIFLLPFLALLLYVDVKAQKLPNIQHGPVLAPENIRIDGRAGEWKDGFMAYNRSTELYYSVANDKNYLFVAIQAKDPVIVKKILAGGITFKANLNAKNDEQSIAITYPRVATTAKPELGTLITAMPLPGNVQAKPRADSLAQAINKLLNANIKEIKITGISALTDTLYSVYNNTGIKTAIHFETNGALTTELAIPLKYMEFLKDRSQPFKYQIMLNGLLEAETIRLKNPTPNGPVSVVSIPRSMSGGVGSAISRTINYPTDLWGDYTLVKQ